MGCPWWHPKYQFNGDDLDDEPWSAADGGMERKKKKNRRYLVPHTPTTC